MNEEGFNLSEWALKHRQLMVFTMVLVFVMGVFSYFRLGREEDPGYVVRTMVVQTQWPGASAKEVEEQVTDKIEKKLQELPGLWYVKSYSQPGKSTVFVNLEDDALKKLTDLCVETAARTNCQNGALLGFFFCGIRNVDGSHFLLFLLHQFNDDTIAYRF